MPAVPDVGAARGSTGTRRLRPEVPDLLNRRHAGPVLVALDGCTWDAVEWAAAEAAARQCALRIVASIDCPVVTVDPLGGAVVNWWQDCPLAIASGQLAEAAARVRVIAPGVQIETELLPGALSAATLRASRDHGLIVFGSKGVGRRLARRARCPVAVVRFPKDIDAGPFAARVVVGVDSTRDPSAALALAFRSALQRGVGVTVVRGWMPRSRVDGVTALEHEGTPPPSTCFESTLRLWQVMFPDVAVHQKLVTGPLGPALVGECVGAALVVVATRPHGRVHRRLFDSVWRRVIEGAPCPVAFIGRQERTSRRGAGA